MHYAALTHATKVESLAIAKAYQDDAVLFLKFVVPFSTPLSTYDCPIAILRELPNHGILMVLYIADNLIIHLQNSQT